MIQIVVTISGKSQGASFSYNLNEKVDYEKDPIGSPKEMNDIKERLIKVLDAIAPEENEHDNPI